MAQISAIKPAGQIIPKWNTVIDWLLRWRLVEYYMWTCRVCICFAPVGFCLNENSQLSAFFFVCVYCARCNNKQPPWRSEWNCRCCYHYYFLLLLKRVDWKSRLMTSAETLAHIQHRRVRALRRRRKKHQPSASVLLVLFWCVSGERRVNSITIN